MESVTEFYFILTLCVYSIAQSLLKLGYLINSAVSCLGFRFKTVGLFKKKAQELSDKMQK